MEIEEWKFIEGYEGLYKISSFGNFTSLLDKEKRPIIDKDGYYHVMLCYVMLCYVMLYSKQKGYKPKNKAIHRLVLETFVGYCPEGLEGSHKDGDKQNNNVSNLVWESHFDNERRKNKHGSRNTVNGKDHPLYKKYLCFKKEEVDDILRMYSIKGAYHKTQKELAELFEVSHKAIHEVIKRNIIK